MCCVGDSLILCCSWIDDLGLKFGLFDFLGNGVRASLKQLFYSFHSYEWGQLSVLAMARGFE